VGTRAPHGPDGSDVTATHAAQDVGGLDTVDHTAAVVAMHAVLGATPARVVLASLGDAVGDLRQPNLPGTTDQYPNWCLPVADRDGRPISLEELKRHPGVLRTASVLSDAVTRPTR
jgi:4-alpha-glucanotransferase